MHPHFPHSCSFPITLFLILILPHQLPLSPITIRTLDFLTNETGTHWSSQSKEGRTELHFFFLAMPCSMETLVLQPGIKLRSHAVEGWSLNRDSEESPQTYIFKRSLCCGWRRDWRLQECSQLKRTTEVQARDSERVACDRHRITDEKCLATDDKANKILRIREKLNLTFRF